MQPSPKNRIVFIQASDILSHSSRREYSAIIDAAIPVPVELRDGEEAPDNADISEEMILSGMLRLLAAEPDHQNAAYYRYCVLSARPNILDELTYAAMMKAENGNFSLAIEILDTLKGLFPYSSELLACKNTVLKKKKAAALQKNAPEALPETLDADALFAQAYHNIHNGDIDEGLANIHAFLERNPHVWNAWFLLGWGLRKAARYKEAESVFRTAMEKGGANVDARNELAICLMETGDLKGARKELETALHTEPENVKVISNLGVLALKMGNETEASGFFRTVLEIDPHDAIAKAALDKITQPVESGEERGP
ncbi:MAG: tetratricopeptide repeat protein [Treponema sp.]|jgi:tetratricopeptide (TPR) repeat protein|nr:tetratricopeptide repeat protein [Treponema sp.]